MFETRNPPATVDVAGGFLFVGEVMNLVCYVKSRSLVVPNRSHAREFLTMLGGVVSTK